MAKRDAMERLFRRAWAAWPSYLEDSQDAAWQAWQSLAPEDRSAAAEAIERYVQACQDGVARRCAFGVYLREKRWEALPPPVVEAQTDHAPPFGPVWSAYLIACLLSGDPERHVGALYRMARERRRHRFGWRWHAMKPLLEAVPVGSELFEEWRLEFETRGWQWIPHPGGQRVVYFPVGGPGGLKEFEAAIRADETGTSEAAE
ncbi:hypothetical protein [uncultured Nitratireductor sp.]|uniref:hypothetical protein n=1 Tax=uncultured Nitratireductor sp. TaxID=520953 RepID=UPI0026222862|nr:hypothetical protein [uncultured Nitratireductor sp.]